MKLPAPQQSTLFQQLIVVSMLVGLFFLMHPYQGLVHDSRIYTLQALNLLHPELYGNDVYLKFGSQDSYSLFSPIYAGLISLIGAERAAALLSIIANVAVLYGAWRLARSLMLPTYASLAIGLLILVPGYYGPDEFFAILEGFITPRQLAQALVLFAVAAWLQQQRKLCVAFLAAALIIHPIMAFSGVLLLLAVWALPWWRHLWIPAMLAGALALAAIFNWLPIARWQFDSQWWPMVARENLLLLDKWNMSDWARVITTQVTLAIAAMVLRDRARQLACGLLLVSGASLLLSWIGGDILRLVIVIQGQAWRSLWLATTVATLLLVPITSTCWRGTALSRAGVMLLFAAWAAGHQSLALAFSAPALIAVACAKAPLPDRFGRIVVLCTTALLALAVICIVAVTLNDYPDSWDSARSVQWLKFLRKICEDRLLPCIALVLVWYLGITIRSRISRIALAFAVVLPAAAVAGIATDSWVRERYPSSAYQAFSAWRALVPQGAEVLWASELMRGSDPTSVWLLLNRPSYYSSVQVNSALFSRSAAMELSSRHQLIPRGLQTEQTVRLVYSDASGFLSCSDIPTRFVITNMVIEGAHTVHAPATAPAPFDSLTLRICP